MPAPLPATPPGLASAADAAETNASLAAAASRLAALLTGAGRGLADPTGRDLEFVDDVAIRPLKRSLPPSEAWAVDGGQALVADARCLQVLITRAARVLFRDGACVLEDEGHVRAHLLGTGTDRAAALASLALPELDPHTSVDVNLLRDRWEWQAVADSIGEAADGAIVFVDGDLQPDWRIPSSYVAGLLAAAAARGIVLVGVTKHSSLSRGGAPLIGQLEREAAARFGPRSMWWAPVARTRPDLAGRGGAELQVVAARLDPDARFAFRIDLPGGADAAEVLGMVAAVADDAAFPGYPYPLSVVDRLAACPGWMREEVRMRLNDLLVRSGVPHDVRDRAFTDRHSLMERA